MKGSERAPRRARGWRLMAFALAPLLLATLGWRIWHWSVPQVPAIEVQATPLQRSLQFSARVERLSRVDVGATLVGRVQSVAVRAGAQVAQGALLVQLETDEARAALVQAQATLAQQQARAAGLRSTGRSGIAAQLAQAEAGLRAARRDLERSRALLAQGFVSQAQVDDSERALLVAQAQQRGAAAQRDAYQDGGSEIAQARAQVAQAGAAVDAARLRLAQTAVRAPADAQVLTRSVEPGQIVQPGTALLRLALAGPTQIVAQVDERFLDQLRTGQRAAVVADAFPAQPLAAQIISISPAVDAQRGAVEVKLALDAAAPDFLREDMTLSVEAVTGERARALVLPLAALQAPARAAGRADISAADPAASAASAQVMVVEGGKARARSVTLGLRSLSAVEVLSGLDAGERVLTAPVADGQRLRAVVAPSAR
ncbi:efflux RND transporter periplasmic adaptor subunit [Comamonas sp.]|uniref:efflux RND transporter periplasmic adaptor subunit n=1 Tax=Comamonas sp. TaxID=34028 RepID=UPI002FCB0C01